MIVSGLAHASLLVRDLPRAVHFYCAVLGLQPCARPELGYEGVWLELGGSQQLHLLALQTEPETATRQPSQDWHLAFWVPSIRILEQQLATERIAITRSRSGRPALFCRDPDGNALEFIEQSEAHLNP